MTVPLQAAAATGLARRLPVETSEMDADVQPRYSSVHQTLHWVTVFLMLAVLPLGWVVISLPEDTPIFYSWLYIHEGVGLVILFLTIFRIGWRIHDGPPALPKSIRRWSRHAVHLVYFALFAGMVVMPLSGYLWSTGHGHEVVPFDLISFPKIAFGSAFIGDAAKAIHQYGQWVIYALIGVHLSGVSYHLIARRDGILGRMLPPNATEPALDQ